MNLSVNERCSNCLCVCVCVFVCERDLMNRLLRLLTTCTICQVAYVVVFVPMSVSECVSERVCLSLRLSS